MKLTLVVCLSLLLAAGLAAVLPSAQAAPTSFNTYVVNSTYDLPDADTLNPACQTISNTCTLRAAVMQANVSHGPATITVPAGTFLLTRDGFDDSGDFGDLDIKTDLSIQGAGSGQTFIYNNTQLGERIFDLLPPAIAVTMTGLTIGYGRADPSAGGGIQRTTASGGPQPSLVLSDVILTHNISNFGGGIYADGGSLTLDNVVMADNHSQNGGGGMLGTGITLTVRNSRIYSNTAGDVGGGFFLSTSNWRIVQSDITSNTAAVSGGGIYNRLGYSVLVLGPALLDSSLRANHAQVGGALSSNSTLYVARSLFASNTADTLGGAVYISYTDSSGSLRFVDSTFSGNAAADGGAMYLSGTCGTCGTLFLRDSTLSGNNAKRGGAIQASDGARLGLFNATIAYNSVFRLIGQTYPAFGGGLLITSTAQVTAQNSLIAQNTFDNAILPVPDDCHGTLHSAGYNLIESTTNCAVAGITTGNVTGQDPLLGPLRDNGGPATGLGQGATPTHALLAGSPAIDAGNPAGCKDETGAVHAIDQRGWARPYPQGGRCDIGAYERGAFRYLPVVRR
jgi:hypothetical protein